MNAAGFICAFVPGGLVVSGVLGVTSCIISLVATVVPNKTALLVEVTLEDNIKVYVYIPAMA